MPPFSYTPERKLPFLNTAGSQNVSMPMQSDYPPAPVNIYGNAQQPMPMDPSMYGNQPTVPPNYNGMEMGGYGQQNYYETSNNNIVRPL